LANTESTARRNLACVLAQVNTLESLLASEETASSTRPEVSGWSVGEHLEHLLIVDRGVLAAIDRLLAGSLDSAGSISAKGRLVLKLGWMKRGIGKAPASVRPQSVDLQTLRDMLAESRRHLDTLGSQAETIASCRATAPHPIFGHLCPVQWLRFMDVHNRHHLRIVDDILAH